MNGSEVRKEFVKTFQSMCHRWNGWDVWSDWLLMASSAIYNSVHRDPKVEDEYLRAAGKYSPEELTAMSKMLALTTEALELEIQDFLGSIFGELQLHNKDRGQFFTPFELCKLMTRINDPQLPPPGRVLRVGEPASGSGANVLAFHDICRERKIPQEKVFYWLKDIDDRAWRMAYIQVSLCGMAAAVEKGDTLRATTDAVWYTPAYYLYDMPNRLRVDDLMRALPGGEDAAERVDEIREPVAEPEGLHQDPPGPSADPIEGLRPGGDEAIPVGDPLSGDAPEPVVEDPQDQTGPEEAPVEVPPSVPPALMMEPGEQLSLL